MDELKPCPFCQCKLTVLEGVGILPARIRHEESLGCPLSSKTVDYDDWQTRPIEDALQQRVEELEMNVSALRSLNKRLVEMCNYFAEWLENVHIDYSNGNVAPNGMDEGDVLGWRGHRELIKQHTALMKEIGGEE